MEYLVYDRRSHADVYVKWLDGRYTWVPRDDLPDDALTDLADHAKDRYEEYHRVRFGNVRELDVVTAYARALRPPRSRQHAVYPTTWTRRPGDAGFNAYVTPYLERLLTRETHGARCDGTVVPQPYQLTTAYLLHPKGPPIQRLLVAHRTGSGKTQTLLRILGNYFHDPRPKIIIVPTDALRQQLYATLLQDDNPYSAYVRRVGGSSSPMETLGMKGQLRRRGQQGYLAAPLRIYSYNQAGGSQLRAAKWMGATANPFDNKILLMDEAHNLIRPNPHRVKLATSRANLETLRHLLQACTGSVVACLTATPCVDEGRELLDIVKGPGPGTRTDEGFVSCFMGHDAAFPVVRPEGRLPTISRVVLPDRGSMLENFLAERPGTLGRRRHEYAAKKQDWHPAFLADLLARPHEVAPQVLRTAELIAAAPGKVLVITDAHHGFFPLEYLWRHRFGGHGTVKALLGRKTDRRSFDPAMIGVAPRLLRDQVLGPFDHPTNDDGGQIKALLLNAAEFSEGIDFKSVRRIILLDIAGSWGDLQQRVGRAIRTCSHARLPVSDREVEVHMVVSTLPPRGYVRTMRQRRAIVRDFADQRTEDEMVLATLEAQYTRIQGAVCRLAAVAVDRQALTGVGTMVDTCGGDTDQDRWRQHVRGCHRDQEWLQEKQRQERALLPVHSLGATLQDQHAAVVQSGLVTCLLQQPPVDDTVRAINCVDTASRSQCVTDCRNRLGYGVGGHHCRTQLATECPRNDASCVSRVTSQCRNTLGLCAARLHQPLAETTVVVPEAPPPISVVVETPESLQIEGQTYTYRGIEHGDWIRDTTGRVYKNKQ